MGEVWQCSFRQTFRLLPRDKQSVNVRVILSSDGRTPDEILALLPYDKARSKDPKDLPDPKRYRDQRQLLRTLGLVYESELAGKTVLRVTKLARIIHQGDDCGLADVA
jgi:hypothetical protein